MANETKLTIELQTVLRNLNRTLRGLDQIKRRLDSIAAVRFNQRSSTAAVDRQAVAARRLALQQQRLNVIQQRLGVQTQELANRQERARQTAERLARSSDRATQSLARQSRIVQPLQRQLNSLGAAMLRVGGGLRSMGASASILVSGPLVALGTIAARSAADIDSIRNRLIATEGSLEAANQRLAQLRRLADQSIGVTRRAALDAFATLSVVGDVTEETINRQILAMGRLNAAFTIDDQQQFFRNLIQIFTQGFERADIKEALGRVPIFEQLLAQAFGTADREKLRELKAAGKLTLDSFLLGIAEAVNQDPILAGVGESIRVRFAKMVERIQDSLEPLGLAILGPLERIVSTLEPIILRVAEAFNRLPQGMQTAIVAVGILVAALGPVLFILGGIASGVGALATALAALLPILGTIGLPAILAILGGLALTITNIIVVITALGLAWQRNFLGIRELVSNAANAVVNAFDRIRGVLEVATRRILPTLQSITTKVLGVITAAWKRYGVAIVKFVGDAFRLITNITVVFILAFTDFVDLVLKLIDGDWRGAWRAFARIVVSALDNIAPLLARASRLLTRAFALIVLFLARQAVQIARAAQRLANRFVATLAAEIINGFPTIRAALELMFVNAALSINFTSIAALMIARLLAELRKAAREIPPDLFGPTVGGETLFGNLLQQRRKRRRTTTTDTDTEKDDKSLRRQLDKLREAQDKLAEVRDERELAQTRARIETQFEAAKAGLDREQRALENSFEDRLTSIRAYLKKREQLENDQIDAEIQKELELSAVLFRELSARARAADREFETELREIDEDPKLKGAARDAARQAAELKKAAELEKALQEFTIKKAEADARVVELEKQRRDNAEVRLRFERLLTEEIAKQQVQIRADLLDEQGRTADAEALRLKARFTETLRDLRVDTKGLSAELQTALNTVDLTVLQQRLNELPEPVRLLIELLDIGIKRAAIAEQAQLVDTLSVELRTREEAIQNRVLDGLINQREAQAEIVALQQKYRALLLDILKGEKAKAEEIGDQGLIASIEAQIQATERLGIAIDEVGQRINQALFSDLHAGLTGLLSGARRGFEGLKDAAISFAERLLDTLNDIAVTSILQRVEGLFKPDAENTKGTVGGFLSKLFGLTPNPTVVANTTAVTANTAAVAGLTAAITGQQLGGVTEEAAAHLGDTAAEHGTSAAAATALTTGATTAGATLQTAAAAASATTQAGATAATATITAGFTTSITSFIGGVASAAASFAATVVAAGAAFAATVSSSGEGGVLGGLLGGEAGEAATGGLFSAVPGGKIHILEGGYPEAVMTTDPKHYTRQLQILKAYLKETRGLGGRIKSFAAGGMISPSEAIVGGMRGPSLPSSDIGSMVVAAAPSEMRLRQVLVSENELPNWVNSSEGEEVLIDFLHKHQHTIRKIGGGR